MPDAQIANSPTAEELCDRSEAVLRRIIMDGRGETPTRYYFFVEEHHKELQNAREKAGRPDPGFA